MKVAEFESQSSSPKDLFINISFFFFFFFWGGGGGVGMINILPLGTSAIQCIVILL